MPFASCWEQLFFSLFLWGALLVPTGAFMSLCPPFPSNKSNLIKSDKTKRRHDHWSWESNHAGCQRCCVHLCVCTVEYRWHKALTLKVTSLSQRQLNSFWGLNLCTYLQEPLLQKVQRLIYEAKQNSYNSCHIGWLGGFRNYSWTTQIFQL